ncbi:MAG: rRNA maturation RNase YbeY [Candidatus Colwellbacteria bacterium]|nr:rRNA maturation RNase YbeY [Candidatus Colwellbacteria bacterium]
MQRTAARVFQFLKIPNAHINIVLINASGMQRLNREYRGKDKATDVIAVEHPQGFPSIPSGAIGEVYLNPPAVRRKEYSLEYALVHGILHLRGFNHRNKGDKMKMEKLEKRILLWLANTY